MERSNDHGVVVDMNPPGTELLEYMHTEGAAELAAALERCEERAIYDGADPPTRAELVDLYMLRRLHHALRKGLPPRE